MITRANRPVILLVCSDQILRMVLKEVLEDTEFNVIAASGLSSAIDRLKQVQPDLMIMRPYLNSIAGHEAAVYLRTKSPGMRVLMVGGIIDDDRLRYRDTLHTFEIFPKPFTAAELVAKVNEVINAPL